MSVVSTCNNCVFAKYDADQVQVGCKAGRLEQFIQQGVTVRKSWDSPADWSGDGPPPRIGKEFYLIERACNLSRPHDSEWANETPQEEWLSKARAEVTTRFHAVMYAPNGTSTEEVLKTVRSLAGQTPNPAVTVVITGTAPRPSEVMAALKKEFGRGLNWNVRLQAERLRDGNPVGRGRAIDSVVNELRPSDAQFYGVFDAGSEVPPGLLAEIDVALNDQLERFVLLIQSEGLPGIGPVVSVRHHHYLGGNAEAERELSHGQVIRCDSIEEKTSLLVPETGGLVRTIGEFCPKQG